MRLGKTYTKVFAVLLAVALIMAGCAKPAASPAPTADAQPAATNEADAPAQTQEQKAEERTYKIGFSINFTGNAWRATALASLEQEAALHPNVELIILDGQNDINKQVSDIENLIAQGVDGIMCLAGSAVAVEPVLKEARAQGIKVAITNIPITDEDAFDVFIGPDSAKMCELLTRWLFDQIGGKGNIVQLGGTSGNSYTAQWLEVCDRLIKEEYPDIKVLRYMDTNWKEDTAKQIMTDLLLAYPGQIDAVWADGGQNCGGAIKAMVAAGGKLLPVIGNSSYNTVFKLYMENYKANPGWDVCVSSNPTTDTRDSLRYLIKLIDGENVEKYVYSELKQFILSRDAEKLVNYDLPDSMFVDHDLTPENLAKLLKSEIF